MKNRKILIVEDDAFSRGAMEKLLQSYNYNYETASCATAEEAVIKLQAEPFGILITDLRMQRMDGFELIKEARNVDPEISTILVTGLGTDEIRLRAKEAGVNGFFPKPIEWGELTALLDVLTRTGKGGNQNIQWNGKQRYSAFQRGIFIALILSLLTLLIIQISAAQESFPKMNRPNFRMGGPETCLESLSPSLTEDQKKALESLRRAYMAEVRPTRTELFALRLQLRYLLSDPNVQPRILFDQQRKISDLQAKLEELSLSYQVKARSVFTKEQLQRLPQGWAFEIGLGHEVPAMDIGRRSRKGLQ